MVRRSTFTSLRISRQPSVENIGLRTFLSQIEEEAMAIFPPSTSYPRQPRIEDDVLVAASNVVMQGVPEVQPYRQEYLKLPILERRVPSDQWNKLSRAFQRLNGTAKNPVENEEWRRSLDVAAEKHDHDPSEALRLIFKSAVRSLTYDKEDKGPEIALVPRYTRQTALVFDEMAISWGALNKINPGLALPYSGGLIPTMAIVRLPASATTDQVGLFIDLVDTKLADKPLRVDFDQSQIERP